MLTNHILTMRKLLFALTSLFLFSPIFSQLTLGVETGFDQHVAGGGPYIGLVGQYKNLRFGTQLLTQINRFKPYRFEPYSGYRFAHNASQAFGGGISLGYEFKMNSSQRIKPILFYRSSYFKTEYGSDFILECTVGSEYLLENKIKYSQSFSTTQSLMAGITVDLAKNLRIDFMLGSGVYIYRDFSVWRFAAEGENIQGVTQLRPDLNANLSISYNFNLKN